MWVRDNSYQNFKCACLELNSVETCSTDTPSYINLEFIRALFATSKEIHKTHTVYKYRLIKVSCGLSREQNSSL